jgi:hypothetical protein
VYLRKINAFKILKKMTRLHALAGIRPLMSVRKEDSMNIAPRRQGGCAISPPKNVFLKHLFFSSKHNDDAY